MAYTQVGTKIKRVPYYPCSFGQTVALSSDGLTALISSPSPSEQWGQGGWIWVFNGTTWTKQAQLVASTSGPVALSGDGNTAVLANPSQGGTTTVFIRSGTIWTAQAASTLSAAGAGTSGKFGSSVALSEDGNTLLTGNTDWDELYAYSRTAGLWSQQGGKIWAAGRSSSQVGSSVSLSADGNTAIVGGSWDTSQHGAVWFFTRSADVWTAQGGKIDAPSGSSFFGASVRMAADGKTAIVGAPGGYLGVGNAWIYTLIDGVWTQQGSMLAPNDGTATPAFGTSVSLNATGDIALVGGTGNNSNKGAAWIFTRDSGGVWSQQGTKIYPTDVSGSSPYFGCSVSISGTGSTALVGGFADNSSYGAAWIFSAPTATNVTAPASAAAMTGMAPDPVVTIEVSPDVNVTDPPATGTFTAVNPVITTIRLLVVAATVAAATFTAPSHSVVVDAPAFAETAYATFTAPNPRNLIACSIIPAAARASFVAPVPTLHAQDMRHFSSLGSSTSIPGFGRPSQTSLSGDGSTLVIGNPYANGLVKVFSYSNGTWTQQGGDITPPETSGLSFGRSLSQSGDGKTLVIGSTGGAYTFLRQGSQWTLQASLLPSDSTVTSAFGSSVSISSDGNTAIVGGPDPVSIGSTCVFVRTGTVWSQEGPALTTPDNSFGLGSSVSISGDGNTAVVGTLGPPYTWIFVRIGSVWITQGPKIPYTAVSADLSFNGDIAVLSGGAFYSRSSAVWSQLGSNLGGSFVSINDSGTIAIIAKANSVDYPGGRAYIYYWTGSSWTWDSWITNGEFWVLSGNGRRLVGYSISETIPSYGTNDPFPMDVVGTDSSSQGTFALPIPPVVLHSNNEVAAACGQFSLNNPSISVDTSTNTTVNVVATVGSFTAPIPVSRQGCSIQPQSATGIFTSPTPVVSITVHASVTPTAASGLFSSPTPVTTVQRIAIVVSAAGHGVFSAPSPSIVVASPSSVTVASAAGIFTVPSPTVASIWNSSIAASPASSVFTSPLPVISPQRTVSLVAPAASGTFTAPSPLISGKRSTSVSVLAAAGSFTILAPSVGSDKADNIPALAASGVFTAPSPAAGGVRQALFSALAATGVFTGPAPGVGSTLFLNVPATPGIAHFTAPEPITTAGGAKDAHLDVMVSGLAGHSLFVTPAPVVSTNQALSPRGSVKVGDSAAYSVTVGESSVYQLTISDKPLFKVTMGESI